MDDPWSLTLTRSLKLPRKERKLTLPEGWLSGRKRWS